MKEKYFKLKLKLISLIVIVLLVACSVLTYQKADQIRENRIRRIYEIPDFLSELRTNYLMNSDDLIKQVYYAYYSVFNVSDVGFYSMLKDADGNTLVENQNFMIVRKAYEDTLVLDQIFDPIYSDGKEEDIRILLLEDNFGSDKWEDEHAQNNFLNYGFSSMEIIGTCDDTYIYLDELKWTNMLGDESYSYVPEERENNTVEGTVKFEEWAGSRYYGAWPIENKFHIWIDSDYTDAEPELTDEAKEICERVYEDYVNDDLAGDYQAKEGLFTCYIGNIGYLDKEYTMPYIFVFHPVSLALEELSGVFFFAAIFGIAVIIFVCSVINKLYNQRLAYEKNRRELTRGIAHELKTPLAITRGYVENWEYLDEEERHKNAEIMIEEIDHMSKMVTDLLELSHLEAKARKINPESVDIQALTASVLKRMRGTIEERGLIVSVNNDKEESCEGRFVVEADLEMMRTVLVNFISNAVKYADKKIDINLSENGRKIKFIITNDGNAINAEKIDKVWDEFYREESIDNSRIGSTGLGLAITKNILILHDAGYGCKSENEKTSFWFEMKGQSN